MTTKTTAILLIGGLAIALLAGVALGQTFTTVLSEDFESGDLGDWTVGGGTVEVQNVTVFEGEYSLRVRNGQAESPTFSMDNDTAVWVNTSMRLFTDEDNNAAIVSLYEVSPDGNDSNVIVEYQYRIHADQQRQGWGIDGDTVTDSGTSRSDTLGASNTWRETALRYHPGEGEARLFVDGQSVKVEDITDNRSLAGDNYELHIGTSNPDGFTDHYSDNIGVRYAIPSEAGIELETEGFVRPGQRSPYKVNYIENTLLPEQDRNLTEITDEANVTSDDETLLVVDDDTNELIAQENVSGSVNVTAEYNDGELTDTTEIIVGEADMENFEVLPSILRVNALLGSDGPDGGPGGGDQFLVILIAILTGMSATKMSTAFGGLGATQLVVIVGWFGGYVTTFVMLVGLMFAIFVGLNTAQLTASRIR